ncbi:type VI secretion system protein ImpF [Singulisphaera sp. GP187]|uniref:type VI secretion system baseplate subunit TssE n=1 Tax=Singulisphaera sp. GP187 TaxID=1882752 RepID=UPI000929859C|nr:type VI secretion system baseplate subunit TssE [Singulisphaera sp. GP187]SIO60705.1 type VI secretion system protein ImpF [Singulisphaera sp. GP187]
MSPVDPHRGLVPSVLDRLMPQANRSTTPTRSEGVSVEQMIEAVRRDLEALLNTRQSQGDLPKCYEELTHSVFTFGIPDVLVLSTMALERDGEMGPVIAELIERFEPRLCDVQVVLADKDPLGREIRFHIDGRLRVEPYPELGFETVLELTTGRALITSSEG